MGYGIPAMCGQPLALPEPDFWTVVPSRGKSRGSGRTHE